MKRLLAALALVCLLPVSACAERTVLRLLGLEESAEERRAHPDIAYQQVHHDVWGDPMTWIAENGADVVYITPSATYPCCSISTRTDVKERSLMITRRWRLFHPS